VSETTIATAKNLYSSSILESIEAGFEDLYPNNASNKARRELCHDIDVDEANRESEN
jgi:hypothetical protein